MNQHLQSISNFIQQDDSLSADEKNALVKSLKEADEELEITAFKLDKTENVKRTTAILLEETIEELEQKRKAIEVTNAALQKSLDELRAAQAQLEIKNKDLEIEASLERVRAQAMSMRKPDDLSGICEILFTELQTLGFRDLRNTQVVINNDEKGSFLNYDFSDYAGASLTDIFYNSHPVIENFVKQIKRYE